MTISLTSPTFSSLRVIYTYSYDFVRLILYILWTTPKLFENLSILNASSALDIVPKVGADPD